MGTHPADKHLVQGFGHFRFIAIVALEYLAVKLPFSISGDFEILNLPGGSDQVTSVGTIAIASRVGVHAPHDAPMHCSSSSRITCSIKTWTGLTASRRKY